MTKYKVIKIKHHRFAIMNESNQIVKCEHPHITGGLQLIYTTQKKADEALESLNKTKR